MLAVLGCVVAAKWTLGSNLWSSFAYASHPPSWRPAVSTPYSPMPPGSPGAPSDSGRKGKRYALFGCAELDEFETIEPDGVFEEIGHDLSSRVFWLQWKLNTPKRRTRQANGAADGRFPGAASRKSRGGACQRTRTVILG